MQYTAGPRPARLPRPLPKEATATIFSREGLNYLIYHRRRGLYEFLKPQFPFFAMMIALPFFLSYFVQAKIEHDEQRTKARYNDTNEAVHELSLEEELERFRGKFKEPDFSIRHTRMYDDD